MRNGGYQLGIGVCVAILGILLTLETSQAEFVRATRMKADAKL